jgi:hypothetical protein
MRAGIRGIVGFDILRHDEQVELAQRFARTVGARQRHRRVRSHHPQRLDPAMSDIVEHLDGLAPFALRHPRRVPEPPNARDLFRREAHVRGKLVGESANLAAAHRIGLPRKRERPHARLADAAGGEMAVDDRVDLVGALRRLVHALRIAGDGPRGAAEPCAKLREVGFRHAAGLRGGGKIRRNLAGARQRILEAFGVSFDEGEIQRGMIREVGKDGAEQYCVHSRRNRQEQVDVLAGRGAAGVDDDDLCAALGAVLHHAPVKYRMAPRRVGADEQDEVRRVEVFVGAGHRVGAEGAAMAGDRGRHAET